MRVLQLCHKSPYPPIDGGTKAMYGITMGLLKAGHEVKVLTIHTQKHPLDLAKVPKEFSDATRIEGVFADTSINIVDAFTDLVTADNYNISRFFSPDVDIRLIRLLSESSFDLVQLESLFMTPYIATIRRYSKAPIVLRSHNLEHVIQGRLAVGEKNFLKRPYRKFLAKQLQDYEMAVLDRVDAVVAISPSDAAHFADHGTRTPIVTVPFALDPAEYEVEERTRGGKITFFHLGSMDWLPNEEGVHWLLDEVWPKVLAQRPHARLDLAGNKMPENLLRKEVPGVRIRGRVKSAQTFMRDRQVMVVPLFSAGGMRVKIIEGMAMGKPVISTPIGAEGIEYTEGLNILLGQSATEFAKHIIALDEAPDYMRMLGHEARSLIESRYSIRNTVQDLLDLYQRLVKA